MQQAALSELRNLAGQSLEQAGARIGISRSHLSCVERGWARLSPEREVALRGFYMTAIIARMKRLGIAPPEGAK
jgi:transcriptional regulator with XRE-family HTH domain